MNEESQVEETKQVDEEIEVPIREQIARAAERLVKAQSVLSTLSAMNMRQDYEGRKLQAVQYALATFEVNEAYKELHKLID